MSPSSENNYAKWMEEEKDWGLRRLFEPESIYGFRPRLNNIKDKMNEFWALQRKYRESQKKKSGLPS